MSHDATKVVLGATRSSSKQGSESFASDPAVYLAGTAVRRKSDGLLSVVKSEGEWAGISLGKDLADSAKTTVLKAGEQVPLLIERQPARGTVTISNVANLLAVGADTITVGATEFTAQVGAATPGDATFQASGTTAQTATSLMTQINAHAVSSLVVKASIASGAPTVVVITALSNTASGDTIALVYTEGGTGTGAAVSGATLDDSDDSADWVVLGAKVYISDSTGKADDPNSGATISDAVYVSAVLTGITEAGLESACVIVDMPGGL